MIKNFSNFLLDIQLFFVVFYSLNFNTFLVQGTFYIFILAGLF